MTFRKAVCSECVLLNLHFSPEWLIFSKGIPGSEPEKTLPSTCKSLSVAMDNSESCSIEFFLVPALLKSLRSWARWASPSLSTLLEVEPGE